MIKRLSIHAAQHMSDAGMSTAPQKVINSLSSLRNRGQRKPTKDFTAEYIVSEKGVWVVKNETILTFISLKRLYSESDHGEAIRAYETFFPKKKVA